MLPSRRLRGTSYGSPSREVFPPVYQLHVRGIHAVPPAARLHGDLPFWDRAVLQQPGDLPGHVRTALPPGLGVTPLVDECLPAPVRIRASRPVCFGPESFGRVNGKSLNLPFPVFRPSPGRGPAQVLLQGNWFQVRVVHAGAVTAAASTNVINLVQVRDRAVVCQLPGIPVREDLFPVQVEHTVPAGFAALPQQAAMPAGARFLADVEPEPFLRWERPLGLGQLGRAPDIEPQVVPLAQTACLMRPGTALHRAAFRWRRLRRQRAVPVSAHVVLLAQPSGLHRPGAARLRARVCHIGMNTRPSGKFQYDRVQSTRGLIGAGTNLHVFEGVF